MAHTKLNLGTNVGPHMVRINAQLEINKCWN
jgi:hypothetical protein